MVGYDIVADGEVAGAIEGIPGRIEHIVVHPRWQGKGVARANFDELFG
jgi:GNAT superfamily N-acetyltransferase